MPIIAEPFVALATAGQEIRIEPLLHVRGGSAPVRLTAVPAKPEADLVPDFDGGTFRFTSGVVRTHLLEYTVTDGTATATGLVRVDVSAPPESDTTPITVPHTAFLRQKQPVDIDVLATDIDPTGGVLVITGLGDTEAAEGARIEIIDHRILRVTLTRPLETGSTVFGYRVSNGLAEAEGEVTLVMVPEPANPQAPVAAPDTISARTGDVVDVAVLANDEHPDGLPLTLAPTLEKDPAAGLLFVDGDRLRYFAPDTAGEFEATYRVDAEGQFANATVSISVRDADPETNRAPVPSTVTARVIAGETVRIPIPLGGTDPDGDSVQLIGPESNADRGSVIERGADWLEYQAGEYSAGTDTFEYAVIDALGARATGSVRVGIAPRVDGAHAPIAVDDDVTVRPGRTISVRVLENDSDPDGGSLRIAGVEERTDGATAVIDDDRLELTIPDAEGSYAFIYTVENEHLGTATSWVTVEASDDAPLSRPEASDTVLSLSDILDLDRVDVPVLRNVFLADADVGDLTVELLDDYDGGAEVRPDGTIRVDVEDGRRIIPFSVAHPDDPSVKAHAFIWVPGRDDALPQLRTDAPRVRVTSGEEVLLELEDFVIAASGRPVRLTDAANVRASNSDGSELDVDHDTLRYRSEDGYFGPASLSFTVTDGESATDPEGRTGTIVIPIDVLPTENQPPVFSGGVIDFEPGQAKTIDLVKLTDYPYPEALDELEFEVLPPTVEGFRVARDGQQLTVEAEEGTTKGPRGSIAIGVADDAGEGRPGRIDVQVVPSTRPLAQPAPDSVVVARGTTTSIDVLANDGATNPFPDTPLRVVDVSGLDSESLPAGVSIQPSEDRTTLAVTVDSSAAPVNTTLQYQVADATDDPSRYAWGTVTISVQDRPDPVTGASVTGFGDGTLDVVFGAGGFNNSPITGYEIELLDPSSGEVLRRSNCDATTCTVATPGNGQSNAVVVQVRARNGIGLSDPVEVPGPTLVRRHPALAHRASGAAARREAPHRVGSRVVGLRERRRIVRGDGCGRLQRGLGGRRLHGDGLQHRLASTRERQPGAVHRERTQSGVSRARRVDRGGRHRYTVRIARRRRHHRERRRGRRHRHGFVVAVRRERRRHRRLLRAAARRGRIERADRPAGVHGHESRAGYGRRPGERRHRGRSRASRAGCLERAVHRNRHRVGALLLPRVGLQPCGLRQHRGREHRSCARRPARSGRCERHGLAHHRDLGSIHREGGPERVDLRDRPRRPGRRAGGGFGDDLQRHRVAARHLRAPVRRGGALPGAIVLGVGQLRPLVRGPAVECDAVAHVRPPESDLGRGVDDVVVDRGARQLRTPDELPMRRPWR